MNEQKSPLTSLSQNRGKISRTKTTGIGLLVFGAVALVVSYVYSSSILTMIGLSLSIWGTLVLYIQTDEYVKRTLMDAATETSLKTINGIVKELDYQGKAWHLSPIYFENPDTSKVYIAKTGNAIPKTRPIQVEENRTFSINQEGLLVDAPGAGLNKLFEKALGTRFAKVDLAYLQQKLPKLLVEDFEIAEECELMTDGDTICVTLNNCIMKTALDEKTDQPLLPGLGSPIASAIACALAKATGMSVNIASEHQTSDLKGVVLQYQLLRKEKTE